MRENLTRQITFRADAEIVKEMKAGALEEGINKLGPTQFFRLSVFTKVLISSSNFHFRFTHLTLPTCGFSTPYRSIRTLPTLDLTTSVCFAILSRVFGAKFSPVHLVHPEPRRASPARSHSVFLPSQTFRRSDDFACHQISVSSVFSFTYKLPIFYLLCFDIHPCNGVVGGINRCDL
jgi:hypothetical protein